MAELTNGKYFRATDSKTLSNIFAEIDKLEKTELDVEKFTQTDENFMPWLCLALIAVILSYLLRYTILRRIP